MRAMPASDLAWWTCRTCHTVSAYTERDLKKVKGGRPMCTVCDDGTSRFMQRIRFGDLPQQKVFAMHGADEDVIADIADIIRVLPDGIPLTLRITKSGADDDDKVELERLVRQREGAVGIDLKRINYRIAELQNRIDNRRRQQ